MKNDSFKQSMALFLHEMQEQSLSELKRTNSAYNRLYAHKREIRGIVFDKLCADYRHMFEEYTEIIAEISSIEHFHLYTQGIRDCISLISAISRIKYDDIMRP